MYRMMSDILSPKMYNLTSAGGGSLFANINKTHGTSCDYGAVPGSIALTTRSSMVNMAFDQPGNEDREPTGDGLPAMIVFTLVTLK
jgi:hypothetical protein